MLSGVLRRRAAAEWADPWGGRFLRELSIFVEGAASGRSASYKSPAIPLLQRNLAPSLSTPGVGSSLNHNPDTAFAQPLYSQFQRQSRVGWGPAEGRPAVGWSPSLGSTSRGTTSEMFVETASHRLSFPTVFESIQTVAARSTRALSSRPPLPTNSSTPASHVTFGTIFHGTPSRYLSSSSLTSPSPFSSQPLRTAGAPSWKVAGARSHYTRFLGDDGDQLLDPPEAADLVTTAHTGPPVPLHSYPNAMMPFLASPPPLDAVVKIFTVTSSPNYFLPWQNKPQREVSGSGGLHSFPLIACRETCVPCTRGLFGVWTFHYNSLPAAVLSMNEFPCLGLFKVRTASPLFHRLQFLARLSIRSSFSSRTSWTVFYHVD